MSHQPSHWAKTFAFRWLVGFAIHAFALRVLAGSGTISQVFSPGDHVSAATLAAIGLFVVLRVYVVLLWPAALISMLARLQQQYLPRVPARRVAASPTFESHPGT